MLYRYPIHGKNNGYENLKIKRMIKMNEYSNFSFLLRNTLSRKILQCLDRESKPLNPKEIAARSNVARSNVSTKLKGLKDKGFVECINPQDSKWRFYQITLQGKHVLEKVREIVGVPDDD